jgi:hypothetical protein
MFEFIPHDKLFEYHRRAFHVLNWCLDFYHLNDIFEKFKPRDLKFGFKLHGRLFECIIN